MSDQMEERLCGEFYLGTTGTGQWKIICSCGRPLVRQPDTDEKEWGKMKASFMEIHSKEENDLDKTISL